MARWRAEVTSTTSSRNGTGRFRYVVHDMPLMGQDTPAFRRSSANPSGWVNALHLGSTPPATSFPLIAGGGKVSGTLTTSDSTPASLRSWRKVRSLIER